jgi:hypothetical protein
VEVGPVSYERRARRVRWEQQGAVSDAAVLKGYLPGRRAEMPAAQSAALPLAALTPGQVRAAGVRERLWRVARYLVAGGGSLLLQLAIQGLFITLLGLPARPSIVVAYEIAGADWPPSTPPR